MSKIELHVTGNGTARCSNYNPPNLLPVTLYANAYEGEYLRDIYAMSEYAGSVALATVSIQTFTYNDEWGHLDIYIEFSGQTPPEPPEPQPGGLNWLIPVLAKKARERCRY